MAEYCECRAPLESGIASSAPDSAGCQSQLDRGDYELGVKRLHPELALQPDHQALRRVSKHWSVQSFEQAASLTPEQLVQLAETSSHAFRHTLGTLAVENNMPIVVAQEIPGHASASTTSIYVKAKEKRIGEAAER